MIKLLSVVTLCLWLGAVNSKQGDVSISLSARWEGTPYVAEVAEALADENPSLFWTFLDSLSSSPFHANETSPDECWEGIINKASSLLTSPITAHVLPLVLSTRQYSPRLELNRQLRPSINSSFSCCLAVINGDHASTPQEALSLLSSHQGSHLIEAPYETDHLIEAPYETDHLIEAPYETDHLYPQPINSAAQIQAVLYGPFGSSCTREMHSVLSAAAQDPSSSVSYAYRPVLLPSCLLPPSTESIHPCLTLGSESSPLLPGFGIEAVLKNMEYSAVDDKKKNQEGAPDSPLADEGDEEESGGKLGSIRGFDLDQISSNHPDLTSNLRAFRDEHLLPAQSSEEDEESGDSTVKVWMLKDIGLQATQRVLRSPDPLSALVEVSQNFLSQFSSLSKQKVEASLRSAVSINHQILSAGTNALLINGQTFDIGSGSASSFDLFGLLDRVREEARVQGQMTNVTQSLGITDAVIKKILALREKISGGGGEEDTSDQPRLDLGSKLSKMCLFFNNLERDALYRQFGGSVTDILQTYPGRLKPMAKNIFTFVSFADPLDPEALSMAGKIYKMYQEYYPVRFGLVPVVTSIFKRMDVERKTGVAPGAPSWSLMAGSEKMARALLTVRNAFGGPAAFHFWASVAAGGPYLDYSIEPPPSTTSSTTSDLSVAAGVLRALDETIHSSFVMAWNEAAGSATTAKSKIAAKRDPEDAWVQLTEGSGFAAEVGMELQEVSHWMRAKGLAPKPSVAPQLLPWFNGILLKSFEEREFMYNLLSEQQRLQEAVYFGRVDDSEEVLGQILEEHETVTRFNPTLASAPLLAEDAKEGSGAPIVLSLQGWADHPGRSHLNNLSFHIKPSSSSSSSSSQSIPKPHSVTHVVVADVCSESGLDLMREGLKFISSSSAQSKQARVIFIPNPLIGAPPCFAHHLLHSLSLHAPFEAKLSLPSLLLNVFSDSSLLSLLSSPYSSVGDDSEGASKAWEAIKGHAVKAKVNPSLIDEVLNLPGEIDTHSLIQKDLSDLCSSILKVQPGAAAVVSNGRKFLISSPSSPSCSDKDQCTASSSSTVGSSIEFLSEDFSLLHQQLHKGGGGSSLSSLIHKALTSKPPTLTLPSSSSSEGLIDDLVLIPASELSLIKLKSSSSGTKAGGGGGGGGMKAKDLIKTLSEVRDKVTLRLPPPVKDQESKEGTKGQGVEVVLVINPLSRQAQRISQVLQSLYKALGPEGLSITIHLHPDLDLTDLPLKSYYRLALPVIANGESLSSSFPSPPIASLSQLPLKKVLTINMDVPEPWLVEPQKAPYDLDNLILGELPGKRADAEFDLEALMLTGSCIDYAQGQNRGTSPRGLQLHLGTFSHPHLVDTLVMSNLAYFQLKAAPGSWILSLAPGRTRDLYTISSKGGGGGSGEGEVEGLMSTRVVISSLSGKHMILKVNKRPGMEKEDVLMPEGGQQEEEEEEEDDEGGMWGMLFGGDKKKKQDKGEVKGELEASVGEKKKLRGGEVVNVFTVASGHMYERLQKIMMLSVVNQTKSKVKFWMIKNYVSPHHRAVVPALAEKYGFDYEFVTYKWPQWLHKQTDKQRIIWAYKILFLDVLFPLGVQRIIFVDSDQVVRADLAELYHMDIKGAPYAYTPFCDNNKEMDEFRFWKGGFWRDHLRGKPYHISALYLVDLERFRAKAAGDQLRIVYDSLSKDPNSLANLDQDLPNYAQHSIPIHSLSQEWLWCESWCGNETKSRARTIDLCNNPKTKEPKLQAARRILHEWEGLDEMQAEVTRMVDERLKIGVVDQQQPDPVHTDAAAVKADKSKHDEL